jgi:hypothetical protein
MTVEAAVAIASGIAAGSLVLVAFGLDSVIELASAGALMWRLTVGSSEIANVQPDRREWLARCSSQHF